MRARPAASRRWRACCPAPCARGETVPPCRSTIERTMNKPRPSPLSSRSVRRSRGGTARTAARRRCPGAASLRPRPRKSRPPPSDRARTDANHAVRPAQTCSRSRADSRALASGAADRRESRARHRSSSTRCVWPRCAISGSMSSRAATMTSSSIDVLMRIAELTGFDPHALEQIVDEPREPLRAAVQRRDELALPLDAHRADAVAQQLDRGELRRERRAELVRDVREHRVARAARGFELGLVAQHLHLQAVGRRRRARDDDAARAVGAERHDLLDGAAGAATPRFEDRARVIARPAAVRVELRLQHVAAEDGP